MFEYLEHTADIKVRVRSDSLEGLFEEAIKATVNAIYDIDKVENKETRTYETEGVDPGELLYDIGNRILGEIDEGFATGDVKVSLEYRDNKRRARVIYSGEFYNKKKHGFKTLVKAFTYNDLKICLEGYERVGEFVLDI